ncbi:DUF3570 domain-containing protein [Algiphilus aromaticivorans]|uniref:DUF3570 domain-containing protein n=1 Tax=Algiphilus aromaticivorans TaxID=382454 RepID=UPI0018DE26BC|nr:DUF3570 domain-containing protein [Algiphilus aromaticivorans]
MTRTAIVAPLSAATERLLGAAPAPRRRKDARLSAGALVLGLPGMLQAAQPGDWEIDSAVLFYSETDRVQAIEPVIAVRRYFDTDRFLSGKLVFDSLTGASPNGAVPSSLPQTYTRASGNGSYTVGSGEIPLDDTFRDTRVALSSQWQQPLGSSLAGNLGFAASQEYDYQSLAIDGGLSYDLARNNATLSIGMAYATDSIEPEGGVPLEGSCLFGASASNGCTESGFDETRRTSSESKDTLDLLLGYTQVLSPSTVAQLNLSLSRSDGYHNDPFKLVSVIDTDDSAGNGIGEPERHLHESRPQSRSKRGIFARVKHMLFDRDVADASYRFQTDDWGLTSHTVDLRYRWAPWTRHAFTPHLRWYSQSAVDFYAPFLRDDAAPPTHFTADYRQASFEGITVGLEYDHRTSSGRSIRIALEHYSQDGEDPDNAPGQLRGREIFPDMDAFMVRVNFDFGW